MRKRPSVSVFHPYRVFWVGAIAASAACNGADRELTSAAGAAGAGSTDAGIANAGAGPAGAGGSAGAGPATATAADAGTAEAPPTTCAAGDTRECSFDLLCTGVQTCGENGTFGTCACSTAALLGGGIVGARCASDGDCAGGATCLRAEGNDYLGAGGPAGGYCTFSCTTEADDCPARDPESFCAPLGPDASGYCIRTCQSQDPVAGEAKCLNRNDVACISVAADGVELFNGQRQPGYCRPLCGSDAECPAGRVCHAQGHICTDAQIGGAPIGASCTLDSECSGYSCEDRDSEGIGVCTATCVLGSLSGCGYGREPSSRDAACLTPVVAQGRFSEGVGDLGLCRELCDVAADCEQAGEGWACAPITPAAVEFVGRSGACVRD